MVQSVKPKKRQRGNIEQLRSGALRVRVYAGVDPLSKKPHYLIETVPAGPNAEREAEKVRTKLLNRSTSGATRAPTRQSLS